MTPKQKLFIKEYLVDLNATRAAIAAGYSEKGADVAGARLLGNVRVKEQIEQALTKVCAKLDITVEKVLGELAKLGFSNMQDYIVVTEEGFAYADLSKLTRDQAAAIQEITTDSYTERTGEGDEIRVVKKCKFKLGDKRGSLELLGRYLKLFTDKVEVSGKLEHEHRTFDPEKLTDAELAEAERLIESAHTGSNP
jgi:phage terminase small subunit